MISFNLDTIIADIATKLHTTYQKAEKYNYSREYLLPNVSETDLINIGFIKKGLSTATLFPLYEYENLLAIYDYQMLHICELMSSVAANVSYNSKEINEKVDNLLGE